MGMPYPASLKNNPRVFKLKALVPFPQLNRALMEQIRAIKMVLKAFKMIIMKFVTILK